MNAHADSFAWHILPEEGAPLLVAYSGGRDSVALLDRLLTAGRWPLILCHFNHGLRGRESGADARFARAVARRHGLAFEMEKAGTAAHARARKQSIETAARELRHAFLLRSAARHGARHVVLAHHADDQAETVLANLCRGAGLRGLGGMKAAQPMPGGVHFLRPMLGISRAEIDEHLAARGLAWREDASNESPDHRRNRLRHEVLPLLDAIFERRAAPLICRAAAQARAAEDHLEGEARALLAAPALLNADGSLNLTRALRGLHEALLGHTLRLWLRERPGLAGIGSAEVGAARAMLLPGGPAKVNLPGGKHLRRKAGRLWVEG